MNKKIKIVLALVCVFFSFSFAGGDVFADVGTAVTVPQSIKQKMVMQGVWNCYNVVFKSDMDLGKYRGVDSFLDGSDGSKKVILTTNIEDSNYNSVGKTGALDCYSFTRKGGGKTNTGNASNSVFGLSKTLFGRSGSVPPSKTDTIEVIDFFKQMGYKVSLKPGAKSGICYSVQYKVIGERTGQDVTPSSKYPDSYKTNGICVESGKASANDLGNGIFDARGILNPGIRFGVNDQTDDSVVISVKVGNRAERTKSVKVGDIKGSTLMSLVGDECRNAGYSSENCEVYFDGVYYRVNFTGSISQGDLDSWQASHRTGDSYKNVAMKYISNGKIKNLDDAKMKRTDLGLRILYQNYLLQFYGTERKCQDSAPEGDSWVKLDWFDSDKKMETCYINKTVKDSVKNIKVNGVNYGTGFLELQNKSLDDIVNAIKAMPKNYSDEEIAEAILVDEQVQDADPEKTTTCMSSGGVGSLGWIACPLLDFMTNASKDIYNEYIDPLLQVDPKLFTGEGDSNILVAWEGFRNIGNIAFIILLLVVIFSQLTGVGINNYGIKKILPKLIVAAVLVNLSYLICEIFIDLSNIVGNGFQGLFNGLPPDSESANLSFGEYEGTVQLSGGLISIALLVSIVGTGAALFSNPAIILSVLVSALSIVVSTLFLFILLSVREAVIIVLTVASPIAVVCYILPNTKTVFDRWRKLFSGLLLVYPVCGLLVGSGNYVSKLLLSSSVASKSFLSMFTAMIIGVAPIFFIPTVLKSSFSAMGKVGARLSSLGREAGGLASKRMRDSEGYKNAQRMGAERAMRRRAGVKADGSLTFRARQKAKAINAIGNSPLSRVPGIGGAVKGIASGITRYDAGRISAVQKNIGANEEAEAAMINMVAKDAINREHGGDANEYYDKLFKEKAEKGDIAGMNAVLSAANSSGYMKSKDIASMVRRNVDSININDSNKRAAFMSDLAAKHGNGFMSTDYELLDWAKKGGKGNLGNYGEWYENNVKMEDLKPEDIQKLSGDSLAGLIAAGKLGSGMAKSILSSNPNLSDDKKIMLGACADGRIGSGVKFKQLKDEAVNLANGGSITDQSIIQAHKQDVDRWTRTAQQVEVV